MNIFILDKDIKTSVSYYCDSHVVKMCLETAQLIQTTLWIDSIFPKAIPRKLDKEERALLMKTKADVPNLFPYKPTHENHPCAIWARSSLDNYVYMLELFETLLAEYTYRFGKVHGSSKILEDDYEVFTLPKVGLTPFAQAMPDEYKDTCAITAYRNYYINEKSHLLVWTKRDKPYWIGGNNGC